MHICIKRASEWAGVWAYFYNFDYLRADACSRYTIHVYAPPIRLHRLVQFVYALDSLHRKSNLVLCSQRVVVCASLSLLCFFWVRIIYTFNMLVIVGAFTVCSLFLHSSPWSSWKRANRSTDFIVKYKVKEEHQNHFFFLLKNLILCMWLIATMLSSLCASELNLKSRPVRFIQIFNWNKWHFLIAKRSRVRLCSVPLILIGCTYEMCNKRDKKRVRKTNLPYYLTSWADTSSCS